MFVNLKNHCRRNIQKKMFWCLCLETKQVSTCVGEISQILKVVSLKHRRQLLSINVSKSCAYRLPQKSTNNDKKCSFEMDNVSNLKIKLRTKYKCFFEYDVTM